MRRDTKRRIELYEGRLPHVREMIIMRKQKNRGRIYPWFMVLYGITRFGWNLLRETKPFVWVLPAGNFWSLIAIVIGVLWLLIDRKKDMELKAFDK